MPKRNARGLPAPVLLAATSAVGSLLLVLGVLRVLPSVDPNDERERSLSLTPERAAESFVAAYTGADYARAARFSSGDLARELRGRARSRRLSGATTTHRERALLIEESFFLTQGRLRLTGIAARGDADHETSSTQDDWPVSLVLGREGDRYLVEEVSWPKGAPIDLP